MSETVGQKLEKKQKASAQVEKCNICSAPREVTYQEKDEETGKIETKIHTVQCNGHVGVPAYLWNLHPDYTKFRQFQVRYRQQCSKPRKEK